MKRMGRSKNKWENTQRNQVLDLFKGERKDFGVRGWRTPGEPVADQLCRAHTGTESEAASMGLMGLHWVLSTYMLWLLAWCFCGLLTVGMGVSLTLLPALGTLFLFLGCFFQPGYGGLCLVLLYLVLSCLAVVFWRPVLF